MKTLILLFVMTVNCLAATVSLDEKFVKALHQVESSGRVGVIIGDGGKALGPFQIHKEYWKDACEYDASIGGSYADCADYQYSLRVVGAYLRRYALQAIKDKNYETLARIHNGGPNGAKRQSTAQYWHRFRRELQRLP